MSNHLLDLVARIKRVFQARSLLAFSDRYMTLGSVVQRQQQQIDDLQARNSMLGDLSKMRRDRLYQAQSQLDTFRCRLVNFSEINERYRGALAEIEALPGQLAAPGGSVRRAAGIARRALA